MENKDFIYHCRNYWTNLIKVGIYLTNLNTESDRQIREALNLKNVPAYDWEEVKGFATQSPEFWEECIVIDQDFTRYNKKYYEYSNRKVLLVPRDEFRPAIESYDIAITRFSIFVPHNKQKILVLLQYDEQHIESFGHKPIIKDDDTLVGIINGIVNKRLVPYGLNPVESTIEEVRLNFPYRTSGIEI